MIKGLKTIIWGLIKSIAFLRFFYETRETQTPITIKLWFYQKVLGINGSAYWPMHPSSVVGNVMNIYAGIDTSPGYSPGCYIQGGGKTYIGDYTQIGPNVGIISSNHDIYDSRKKNIREVHIGKYCWIGMNAIILPGVVLGDFTIVAAGSVVTKSFEDGYCIIGGNTAKKIKDLDPGLCIRFNNSFEYNGYVKSQDFEKFRIKNLNV
jgi:acetyltransferase-like isoleucine patch superfamily enzyme